jgi:hypothetical protein
MKDMPPEVATQLANSIPLFALGLALFLTAFLLIIGALFSLVPNVYNERRENEPNTKKKAFALMIGTAFLCALLGWLSLHGLSSYLVEAAITMSNVEEVK